MRPSPENISKLTDHLFRHESGKMVSVLTRIFGTENLQVAEDVVQDTLLHALNIWKLKGIPDNPSAWLFRVAKNKAIDIIRRNKHSVQYDFSDSDKILLTSEYTINSAMEQMWQEDLLQDDMLRMMFACCHPGISQENQISLILKTLCGFSISEIAQAFLTSEDAVTKRLYRTREFFRENKIKLEIPSVDELKKRTDAVLNAIYLLFSEGYHSSGNQEVIRQDLIHESMLLCKLLTENKHSQVPGTYALMALICFHASRSKSRFSAAGDIILLSEQDRSNWNFDLITLGNEYMDKAAFGAEVSAYHLEAAIAFEHCSALSFDATNWNRILELYNWLCKIAPSPVAFMNKAVAVMQVHGAKPALVELLQIPEKSKMEKYYLYQSLLGEVYARLGQTEKAESHFKTALDLAGTNKEKKVIWDKISAL